MNNNAIIPGRQIHMVIDYCWVCPVFSKHWLFLLLFFHFLPVITDSYPPVSFFLLHFFQVSRLGLVLRCFGFSALQLCAGKSNVENSRMITHPKKKSRFNLQLSKQKKKSSTNKHHQCPGFKSHFIICVIFFEILNQLKIVQKN